MSAAIARTGGLARRPGIDAWEGAYLRFETPAEEQRKFLAGSERRERRVGDETALFSTCSQGGVGARTH